MRSKEFLENLQKLNFPIEEYYILGGGALLLYGIRKETTDIYLSISIKLFKTLSIEGIIDIDSKDRQGFYKLVDFPNIKVVPNSKEKFKCMRFGDLYLEDIRQILEYKKNSNKKKDKADIEAINYFLEIYPRYPKF